MRRNRVVAFGLGALTLLGAVAWEFSTSVVPDMVVDHVRESRSEARAQEKHRAEQDLKGRLAGEWTLAPLSRASVDAMQDEARVVLLGLLEQPGTGGTRILFQADGTWGAEREGRAKFARALLGKWRVVDEQVWMTLPGKGEMRLAMNGKELRLVGGKDELIVARRP